ncbi:MAG TPA: lysophospholipid acyltransferase family protein, partial [Candidatus Baltobacteraceae bacterium]|nr:lysophospholipid acyltransferase family protein [Candidatus Baltobacteraceae bacterium]
AGRATGRGWHYALTWLVCAVAVRVFFRLRYEGRPRLPDGPYLLCFNHQSWADPFILLAILPWRRRITFFGPKETDLRIGRRNRLIAWSGMALPYRPDKTDLLGASRRVQAVFAAGGVLAIAGEGHIHTGEATLLPLDEGTAFFAQHAGLPIVPVALNGTSWLVFGRRLRVRVGVPIPTAGRSTREAMRELTHETWQALHALCAGYPDPVPPRVGSLWFRFTEAFNEWPEGVRPPVDEATRDD